MTIAAEHVLYAGCLPATSFRDLVDAATTAGFDAISVWPLAYRRAVSREGLTPQTMRALVDDAGLRVAELEPCGDWIPVPADDGGRPGPFRALWTRHDFFAAAAALGTDTIVAVDLAGRRVVAHEAIVEGFAGLCDDAADHGLRVALEFMPFSAITDLASGWRVVTDADRSNGALVLDVCHLARGGWELSTLRAIPPERIAAVQLADGPSLAPDDLLDEAMLHRALPGDGGLDVGAVVDELAAMGVRTHVGPELYRRGWSERPAADVASDLMKATRSVLASDRPGGGP